MSQDGSSGEGGGGHAAQPAIDGQQHGSVGDGSLAVGVADGTPVAAGTAPMLAGGVPEVGHAGGGVSPSGGDSGVALSDDGGVVGAASDAGSVVSAVTAAVVTGAAGSAAADHAGGDAPPSSAGSAGSAAVSTPDEVPWTVAEWKLAGAAAVAAQFMSAQDQRLVDGLLSLAEGFGGPSTRRGADALRRAEGVVERTLHGEAEAAATTVRVGSLTASTSGSAPSGSPKAQSPSLSPVPAAGGHAVVDFGAAALSPVGRASRLEAPPASSPARPAWAREVSVLDASYRSPALDHSAFRAEAGAKDVAGVAGKLVNVLLAAKVPTLSATGRVDVWLNELTIATRSFGYQVRDLARALPMLVPDHFKGVVATALAAAEERDPDATWSQVIGEVARVIQNPQAELIARAAYDSAAQLASETAAMFVSRLDRLRAEAGVKLDTPGDVASACYAMASKLRDPSLAQALRVYLLGRQNSGDHVTVAAVAAWVVAAEVTLAPSVAAPAPTRQPLGEATSAPARGGLRAGSGPGEGCLLHEIEGYSTHSNRKCTLQNTSDKRARVMARLAAVSQDERRPRKCYGCQQTGHVVRECPELARLRAASAKNAGAGPSVSAVSAPEPEPGALDGVEDPFDNLVIAYDADGGADIAHVASAASRKAGLASRPVITLRARAGIVRCLVDTGANVSILTPGAAAKLGLRVTKRRQPLVLQGAMPTWSTVSTHTAKWSVGPRTVTAAIVEALGDGFDGIIGTDAMADTRSLGTALAEGAHVAMISSRGSEVVDVNLVRAVEAGYERRQVSDPDVAPGAIRVVAPGHTHGPIVHGEFFNAVTTHDFDEHVDTVVTAAYLQAFHGGDPKRPRLRVNNNLAPVVIHAKPGVDNSTLPWINGEPARGAVDAGVLRRWIADAEAAGMIEEIGPDPRDPSARPANTACLQTFVVGGKRLILNGKPLNPCIDTTKYRVVDERPLVAQQEEMARVRPGTARVMSGLDLKSGFHQIPVCRTAGIQVATVMLGKLYVMRALGMGFNVSPCVFHSYVDQVMQESDPGKGSRGGRYVDDLAPADDVVRETRNGVTKWNIAPHVVRVKRILDYGRHPEGLVFGVNKLEFFAARLVFGGVRAGHNRLEVLPSRVIALAKTRPPTTGAELRGWLGALVYIARFVPRLTAILGPLFEVSGTRGSLDKVIGAARVEAIVDGVTEALKHVQSLYVPEPGETLIVAVDTSTHGTGAVLFTGTLEDPKIVACYSTGLSREQLAQAPNGLELGGVMRALEAFQKWFDPRIPFILLTDHASLVSTLNRGTHSRVVARRYGALLQFNFVCAHLDGERMGIADGLSRCMPPVSEASPMTEDDIRTPVLGSPPRQLLRRGLLPDGGARDVDQVLRALRVTAAGYRGADQGAGQPDIKEMGPWPTAREANTGGVAVVTRRAAARDEDAQSIRPPAGGQDRALGRDRQPDQDGNDGVPRGGQDNPAENEATARGQDDGEAREPREVPPVEATAAADNEAPDRCPINGAAWWIAEYDADGEPREPLLGIKNKVADLNTRLVPREQEDRNRIVRRAHSMGHKKARVLAQLIRSQWHWDWPDLTTDIETVTGKCKHCQRFAVATAPISLPMLDTHRSLPPGHALAVDVWTAPEVSKEGYRAALIMVDPTTGFTMARQLKTKSTKECADAISDVTLVTGLVTRISSDHGGENESSLVEEWTNNLRIKHHFSVAHRAQGNAVAENGVRRVFDTVKLMLDEFGGDWSDHLASACYYINMMPTSASHGLSRFELYMGRRPVLPADYRHVAIKETPDDTDTAERVEQVRWLNDIMRPGLAMRRAAEATASVERAGDIEGKRLSIGAAVMLYDHERTNKLSAGWLGPFKVATYDKLTRTYTISNADGRPIDRRLHRSMLKPYSGTVDEAELHVVKEIIAEESDDQGSWVQVRWRNHDPQDLWWIPTESLAEPDMLRKFRRDKARKDKQARD